MTMARTQGIIAHRRRCGGTGTGLSHYVFLEQEAGKRPRRPDGQRAKAGKPRAERRK